MPGAVSTLQAHWASPPLCGDDSDPSGGVFRVGGSPGDGAAWAGIPSLPPNLSPLGHTGLAGLPLLQRLSTLGVVCS